MPSETDQFECTTGNESSTQTSLEWHPCLCRCQTVMSCMIQSLDLAGFRTHACCSCCPCSSRGGHGRGAHVHNAFRASDVGQLGPPLYSPTIGDATGATRSSYSVSPSNRTMEATRREAQSSDAHGGFEAIVLAAVCGAIDRAVEQGMSMDAWLTISTTDEGLRAACHVRDGKVHTEVKGEIGSVLTKVCGISDKAVIAHLSQRIIVQSQSDATRGDSKVGASVLTLREVFKDVVFDSIAGALQAHDDANLRILFKSFDTHSFGNLDRLEFARMLTHFCGDAIPSPRVLDFVFDSVAKDNTARIEYSHLFDSVFRARVQPAVQHRPRTIRSVAVISRHGARLPLKSFPKTLRWPTSASFWRVYGGKLTPVGVDQHLRLGESLRRKYVVNEGLFDELLPDTPSRIVAYTSNMDRTLMSAQSCLLGFFPGASIAFVVDEDGEGDAHEGKEPASQDSIRICMSMSDYTPLLHGFKQNPAYSKLKAAAIDAGQFHAWARSSTHTSVVDKLWEMTGFENISPKLSMARRLANLQSVAQQIGIEKAHQMEVLMNAGGMQLDLHDQEVIMDVAQYICRLRYCGHSADDQASLSRLASGLLPAAIVNNFRAVAEESDKGGHFTLYSAHDNTIMALLAHLGFRNFPLPSFAAHLVFELHEIDGEHFVKVLYNPDPHKYTFDGAPTDGSKGLTPCDYVELPRAGVVDWSERCTAAGSGMHLHEFVSLLMDTRGSFRTPEDWNTAAHEVDEDGDDSPADEPVEQSETYDTIDFDKWAGLPHGKSPSTSISLMGHEFREHITRSSVLSKPRVSGLPLRPFKGQVAGHPMTFMELGDTMLCKPVRATCAKERLFYQWLFSSDHHEPDAAVLGLVPFLPTYFGEIFVNAKVQTIHRVKSDGATTSVRTRSFSLSVPPEYELVELDTGDLEAGPTHLVPGSLSTESAPSPDGVCPPLSADEGATGQVCIVIENLLAQFSKPCILDVKVGTRQHGDEVTGPKRERAIQRCAQTTSAILGLRVSGMRVWQDDQDEPVTFDKVYGKQLTEHTFNDVFEQFFDNGKGGLRLEVMRRVQKRVEELKDVVKNIPGFRFFSSSLLVVYDADSTNDAVDVRLIDFARVRIPHMDTIDVQAEEAMKPDEGALLGLSSFAERLHAVRSASASDPQDTETPLTD
eukprot:m.68019 g.68019  ORF g.68019 m.68019 type:complete len:1158 (+) comp8484_c0_seq1:350-3823(+)